MVPSNIDTRIGNILSLEHRCADDNGWIECSETTWRFPGD